MGLVVSLGAILALLSVAIVVTAGLALRLASELDRAQALQAEAERQRRAAESFAAQAEGHRVEAAREAEGAAAISDFLESVLASAEPYVARHDASIADAVRWASERVDERFAGRPDLAAALHQRLASILYSRGELDASLEHARTAARLRENEERASDYLAEGNVLIEKGRYAEAETLLERAREMLEVQGSEGEQELLTALTSLGATLLYQGKYTEAELLLHRAWERRSELLGPEHPYTLTSLNNLANLLMKTGRESQALPLLRDLMEIQRRTLTTRHPNTILSIHNYADALRVLGQLEEAEGYFLEAIELDRRHLPTGHWFLGLHRSRYGELLEALGRPEEAEQELVNGHEILERALGADHDRTQRAVRALIGLHERRGDHARALEWRARLAAESPR